MEDSNNFSHPTQFNGSNTNTAWINATTSSPNQITGNNYFNAQSPPVYLAGAAGIANTYSNNTLTLNAVIPGITPNNTTFLYFRLGLPMNKSIGFKYVNASV